MTCWDLPEQWSETLVHVVDRRDGGVPLARVVGVDHLVGVLGDDLELCDGFGPAVFLLVVVSSAAVLVQPPVTRGDPSAGGVGVAGRHLFGVGHQPLLGGNVNDGLGVVAALHRRRPDGCPLLLFL